MRVIIEEGQACRRLVCVHVHVKVRYIVQVIHGETILYPIANYFGIFYVLNVKARDKLQLFLPSWL